MGKVHMFSFAPNATAAAFRKSESGVVAIALALTVTVLGGFVGGAIDYGRWQVADAKMRDLLDAASLAGGRSILLEGPEAAVAAAERSFSANRPAAYAAINAQFTLVDQSAVKGVIDSNIPSTFLAILGISQLSIKIENEVAVGGASGGTSGGELEIAVMLDVTGSMCDDGAGPCSGGTKLSGMRAATIDLAEIALRANASGSRNRIALIPFSTLVRLGPNGVASGAIMQATTNLNPTWSGWRNSCTSWSFGSSTSTELPITDVCLVSQPVYSSDFAIRPCISDRNGPDEFTDAAPGPDRWLNAHDGVRAPISMSSLSEPLTMYTGTSESDPIAYYNYWIDGGCYQMNVPNAMLPLTDNLSDVRNLVNGLMAEGATAGALGTAVTWYTLSPEWGSVWPSQSRPAPYSDLQVMVDGKPKLRKVAVLMSDGVYNAFRAGKNQDPEMVSLRAKQLCTNMKAKGIEIFTVGYDLDSLSGPERARAVETLQSCGTSLSHFYDSLTPTDLQMAFRSIAFQMASVRIAK